MVRRTEAEVLSANIETGRQSKMEMLSIITAFYSGPSVYQLYKLAQPVVTNPTDVLIETYAGNINAVYVKKATGLLQLVMASCMRFTLPASALMRFGTT